MKHRISAQQQAVNRYMQFFMQHLNIYSIFLATMFLISCSSSADKTQVFGDTTSSDKLIATDSAKETKDNQSLAGKIFFFAPELDNNTCTATGACDCCSSSILFLSDSNFLMVDYCEGSYSYFKGIYRLDNSALKLQFDKLSVNKDYNWEKVTDTASATKPDYFYNVETIKPTTATYERQECSGSILFKGDNEYGALDKYRTFNDELKSIKDDGIWSRMKLQ